MPPADRPDDLDELNDFWNGIGAGKPKASRFNLDPDLVATVHLLQDLGTATPPAGARDRVRRRLGLDAGDPDSGMTAGLTSLTALPPTPNGHVVPALPPRQPRRSGSHLVGRVWPLAELAAAVLLIAALGAVATGTFPMIRHGDPGGSAWTMYRGGPSHTGFSSDPGPEGVPALRWTFAPDAPVYPAIVVADGVAYVAGDEAHLYALDAASGKELWRFPVGATVSGTPAVADGTVYVGAKDGTLYAIDAKSGTERWRLATGGLVCCSPTFMNGTLYVGNDAGDLLAVDAAGNEHWRFHLDGASWSSPAVADGTVYAGTDRRLLYAIDVATGAERWHVRLAGREVPAVAVADSTVYVGTWDGALYAIDATTGAERWRFGTDATVFTPAVGAALVYAGSENGSVYALDAVTGAERWRFDTGGDVITPPAITADTVYVGSLDGYLYALNAATGAERWRFGAASVAQGPVVADGVVYVAGVNGIVYAVGGGGEAGAAATPVVDPDVRCGCGSVPWRR